MQGIVDWAKGVIESFAAGNGGSNSMGVVKTFTMSASHHGTREQRSTIADSVGNQVTVVSTADGGTRLVARELFETKPVQDFVQAVKAKKTLAAQP